MGWTADEISEGAGLLTVADAFDVMTIGRRYSVPKPVDEALAECFSLIGLQFTQTAVNALMELHSSGELLREEPPRAMVAGRGR